MSTTDPRFEASIALLDGANADDPHRESVDGVMQPKELVYARRMSERLHRFAPDASEALQLAVRGQHLERWTTPRSTFPPGRTGYRRWRTALATFHAERVGELLARAGYGQPLIARVQALVRKERLSTDPEAQTLEDVACLVFLEHYASAFATEHDEPTLIRILARTWRKMSARARTAALALDLAPAVSDLIRKAVPDAGSVARPQPRPDR